MGLSIGLWIPRVTGGALHRGRVSHPRLTALVCIGNTIICASRPIAGLGKPAFMIYS